MQAYLQLDLAKTGETISYEQPEIQLVKGHFKEVVTLDLDAGSDELLLHYARKMMQQATQIIVCVKADEDPALPHFNAVLEELLQFKGQHLILLRSENQRLQRILQARPSLRFKKIATEADLLTELRSFYRQAADQSNENGSASK